MNLFPINVRLPGRDPRIGILYPASGTRDADFWSFAPPGASIYMARLPLKLAAEDAQALEQHLRVEGAYAQLLPSMAEDMALFEQLLLEDLGVAAIQVAAVQPHVVAWADTTGSFLFGPEGDLRQIEFLSRLTGAYATTTSTAIVAACRALGIDEVDIASPYVEQANESLVAFLHARGVRVGGVRSLALGDSYAIASVPDEEQAALVRAAAGSAPAVLVPCTDFFSLSLIAPLEEELDRPILAANAVTMWHTVQGIGGHPPGHVAGFGRLFQVGARVMS